MKLKANGKLQAYQPKAVCCCEDETKRGQNGKIVKTNPKQQHKLTPTFLKAYILMILKTSKYNILTYDI